jgi:hypothetical protein
MPATHSPTAQAFDSAAVAEAIENITDALERASAGLTTLKTLLIPEPHADTTDFDPKDPANKYEVGGLMKLTPRGIEICYRLFDAGKSRYAVASLMDISFGAATHRLDAWKKLGGTDRIKLPIE